MIQCYQFKAGSESLKTSEPLNARSLEVHGPVKQVHNHAAGA